MQIPRPLGARVLVEELVTSLSIRERGKRSGLLVITAEDDSLSSQCTMGVIVALGADPFLRENGLEVGKVIYFNRHAGDYTFLEGKRYRTLELQQITNVLDSIPSDARLLSEVEPE